MRKAEIIARVSHIIMILLNVGCLFFGVMVFFGGNNEGYRIFRELNISFCDPMFFMRIFYLQYIIFFIIALLYTKIYIYKVKNRCLNKMIVCFDIMLWILAITELLFLENYFECILWF